MSPIINGSVIIVIIILIVFNIIQFKSNKRKERKAQAQAQAIISNKKILITYVHFETDKSLINLNFFINNGFFITIMYNIIL